MMKFAFRVIFSQIVNGLRFQWQMIARVKSETIDNSTILLAAILETVGSKKWPWMQFSSLPINSSLQNNPKYQFSLKSWMVSDFNENWYLGVFWSEELVGNYEICIQDYFYEATIFKMAANKIVELSMVSDFNENWYLRLFWSPLTSWLKMTLNANFIITN
jgi:hypothetical protein